MDLFFESKSASSCIICRQTIVKVVVAGADVVASYIFLQWGRLARRWWSWGIVIVVVTSVDVVRFVSSLQPPTRTAPRLRRPVDLQFSPKMDAPCTSACPATASSTALRRSTHTAPVGKGAPLQQAG